MSVKHHRYFLEKGAVTGARMLSTVFMAKVRHNLDLKGLSEI